MFNLQNQIALFNSLMISPQLLRVNPRVNLFLLKYFAKFNIKRVGPWNVLHSHLPPINSRAYTKFVQKHLIEKVRGPSHAQIGLTNACQQKCPYCYSAKRSGKAMSKEVIIKTIKELSALGVSWLGLTGGEPLLNQDLVEIINAVDKNIAVKLFTTGHGLTMERANDLKNAGLTYVSVSLDSDDEEEHDKIRGCKGAFKEALHAIRLFLDAGIHTGVSSVLNRDMMEKEKIHRLVAFLENLGVHEAWLSEMKPSREPFFEEKFVVNDEETLSLMKFQDEYNKTGKMTVNYLGHFEHGNHFGCNAGGKMVYVDTCGEVSPCVFTPMTFGNVSDKPVSVIYEEMKMHFKSGRECFINNNYSVFRKHFKGISPIPVEETLKIMRESRHSSLPEFNKVQGA